MGNGCKQICSRGCTNGEISWEFLHSYHPQWSCIGGNKSREFLHWCNKQVQDYKNNVHRCQKKCRDAERPPPRPKPGPGPSWAGAKPGRCPSWPGPKPGPGPSRAQAQAGPGPKPGPGPSQAGPKLRPRSSICEDFDPPEATMIVGLKNPKSSMCEDFDPLEAMAPLKRGLKIQDLQLLRISTRRRPKRSTTEA